MVDEEEPAPDPAPLVGVVAPPEVLDAEVDDPDRVDGPGGDATDGGDELAAKMAADNGWGEEAAE